MMTAMNMSLYLNSIITSLLLIAEPVNGERNRYIRLIDNQVIDSKDNQKFKIEPVNFFNQIVHGVKRSLQEEDVFPSLVDYGSHYDTILSMSMSMSMNLNTDSHSSYPSQLPVSPVATTNVPSQAPIVAVSSRIPTASSVKSDISTKKPETITAEITEEYNSTRVPTSTPATFSTNSTSDASSEVSRSGRKVASKPATISSVVVGVMAIISAFVAALARKAYKTKSSGRFALSSLSQAKLLDAKGSHLDDSSTSSDTVAKSNMTSDKEGTNRSSRT